MQGFINEVKERVHAYEERFARLGITARVTKQSFRSDVEERLGNTASHASLLTAVERVMDHRRERKKGYHYEPNRYSVVVLSLLPSDKTLLKREDCKDYAFLLKKTERAHIGDTPEKTECRRDKVLLKIEKRLLKILEKAEGSSVLSLCRNTLWDIFRYAFSTKYGYKEAVRGKDLGTWELIFSIPLGILVSALFALILVAIKTLL